VTRFIYSRTLGDGGDQRIFICIIRGRVALGLGLITFGIS